MLPGWGAYYKHHRIPGFHVCLQRKPVVLIGRLPTCCHIFYHADAKMLIQHSVQTSNSLAQQFLQPLKAGIYSKFHDVLRNCSLIIAEEGPSLSIVWQVVMALITSKKANEVVWELGDMFRSHNASDYMGLSGSKRISWARRDSHLKSGGANLLQSLFQNSTSCCLAEGAIENSHGSLTLDDMAQCKGHFKWDRDICT